MRAYVAGSTKDPRVLPIQGHLSRAGHVVFDWASLEDLGTDRVQIAREELGEVVASDVLVLVWHEGLLGALLETGAALAAGVSVVIYDPDADARTDGLRRSVFWNLPQVSVVHTVPELLNRLGTKLQNSAGSGAGPYERIPR